MPKSYKLQVKQRARRNKVTEVHLAVTSNGNGEEIFTIIGPGGEKIPLTAIDDRGVAVLKDFAQDAANQTGKTVEIVSFTRRKLCDSVSPVSTGD